MNIKFYITKDVVVEFAIARTHAAATLVALKELSDKPYDLLERLIEITAKPEPAKKTGPTKQENERGFSM